MKNERAKELIKEIKEILQEHHVYENTQVKIEPKYKTIKSEEKIIRIQNIILDSEVYGMLNENDLIENVEWSVNLTFRFKSSIIKNKFKERIPEMDIIIY